jgi:hypothetical protein
MRTLQNLDNKSRKAVHKLTLCYLCYRRISIMSDDKTMGGGEQRSSKKWFDGMCVATARRKLKRWTEEKGPHDPATCGTMHGDYFNFKIKKAISITKRDGSLNFFGQYRKRGYFIVKGIFREKFLRVIKREILGAEKPSWFHPAVSHRQLKASLLKTMHVDNPNWSGFLPHFLSRVTAGSFPEKRFLEVAFLRSEYSTPRKWIPCTFHADISDAPAEYLENEKSPISFYFAIENENLQLELIPKSQASGPKPKAKTISLYPGDILLFDTCATVHRTAMPKKTTSPDRLNIVLTGYESYLSLGGDSESDSD